MKRKILLFMMTALLSVGAGAQSLQTKTLFEGPKTVTGSDPLTIAKSELQGARVGSQICIYMDLSVGDQWGDNIVYYNGWNGQSVYRSVSVNPGTGIVVNVLLDADVIDCSSDFTIYPQNDYSTCTVTKVTLNYNGVHLFSDYSPNMWNPWGGVKDMKTYIAQASANDLLSFSFSEVVDWGGSLLFTSGQGNPGDDPKTESTPTIYYSKGSLSTSSNTYIPLTNELLGYSSLFLSGQGYTASSVDLIYQPSAVNIGSAGYATFGYPFAVDLGGLGEGQDAYTVTVSGTKAHLTSVKGNKIPANTGIILKGTNGDAILLPLTTASPDEIGTNDLQVSDGTVKGNGSTIYVLANVGDVLGFYLVENGSAITAGKAYLQVSNSDARQFIGFGDDNETTGIQTVANSQQSAANSYYDLQGRRVAQPTKGLYVVNGKKVIIK